MIALKPVQIRPRGVEVTVPGEELTEALWQGLLVRADYWKRRAKWAKGHSDRLLNEGPDGNHPYRNNPPHARLSAWKDMVDGWMRKEREARDMAALLTELHDQMAEEAWR